MARGYTNRYAAGSLCLKSRDSASEVRVRLFRFGAKPAFGHFGRGAFPLFPASFIRESDITPYPVSEIPFPPGWGLGTPGIPPGMSTNGHFRPRGRETNTPRRVRRGG